MRLPLPPTEGTPQLPVKLTAVSEGTRFRMSGGLHGTGGNRILLLLLLSPSTADTWKEEHGTQLASVGGSKQGANTFRASDASPIATRWRGGEPQWCGHGLGGDPWGCLHIHAVSSWRTEGLPAT